MNPPCVGDETTCGRNFTRSVGCYQVPEGFQFGQNWTAATGVKSINMAYCPDVASTPTYDASTGKSVARGADGKLVVSTTCAPCNFAEAVQSWVMNTCPCVQAGDYCNLSNGVGPDGVCHSDGTTPCNSTICPSSAPARLASRSLAQTSGSGKTLASRLMAKTSSSTNPRTLASRTFKKNSVPSALSLRASTYFKTAPVPQSQRAHFVRGVVSPVSCDAAACSKSCFPGKGSCASGQCGCLNQYAPSYALPSYLKTSSY